MHQRLGRNLGGYFGERIEVPRVLTEIATQAARTGWAMDTLPATPDLELLALRRAVPAPSRRVYLSAGVHGDEPAGPLAVLRLLEEDAWPTDTAVWLCPCLNPRGLAQNTRGNPEGIDLNRDYREPQSAEVRAHLRWLAQQPSFDCALLLHEDWEAHGFYVYEINPDTRPSLAARIVAAVAAVCPIDVSPEIDGWPASAGVIAPAVDPRTRAQWPEAVYLAQTRTRLTCTLEAPSDFTLATRVAALVAGVKAALA